MKIKNLFLALLILPFLCVSQNRARTILNGRVVADSLKVENLTVLNISSNISAVTDENGDFTLFARPADTLLFSGITVREAKLVLKESHFETSKLYVELNVDVTMLDEVVIRADVLTGILDQDSRNTKTKNITSGIDSYKIIASDVRPVANQNTALPTAVTGSQLTGVDFVKAYKMIFNKRKRKDAGEIYAKSNGKTFSENVKERFTYHFFTQMLKIPKDEIGLFLNYCDKKEETIWMLDPKYEFELTDYLVTQSTEYLKKKK